MTEILIASAEDLFAGSFRFMTETDDAAWYDFDGAESQNEDAECLRLNAATRD